MKFVRESCKIRWTFEAGILIALLLTLGVGLSCTKKGRQCEAGMTPQQCAAPAAPLELSYSQSTFAFTVQEAIEDLTPTYSSSGGAPTEFEVEPALPDGLELDAVTGVISGTPTAITSAADYVIVASNESGSSSITLSLAVNDVAPSGLTYSLSTLSLRISNPMTALTPTSSGGAVLSYTISPDLPTGLSLNTSSGVISGTPTVGALAADYTITASNSGGNTSFILNLAVQVPASLSFSDSPSYNFGSQVIGFSSEKTLSVQYESGNVPATSLSFSGLSGVFQYKGGSYPGTGGTCGSSISSTCTIVINYTPVSAVVSNSTIQLSYSNGFNTVTTSRDLSGTGVAGANLGFQGGALISLFTLVHPVSSGAQTVEKTVTIENSGQMAATSLIMSLSAPFSFKGGTYPGAGGTCGTSLNSSGTCTVVIIFSPTFGGVIHRGALALSYNNGASTVTSNQTLLGPTTGMSLGGIDGDGYVGYFGCGLKSDGTVKCWGSNGNGQLGTGDTTSSISPTSASISSVIQLSSGGGHTCALISDGTVKCWGRGSNKEAGTSSTTNPTPVAVSGISQAVHIASGKSHSCAVLQNGSVQCWGNKEYGKLGDEVSSGTTSTPVTVSGVSTATEVACGSEHTCVLLSNGTIQCWGNNSDGQLGAGDLAPRTSPVSVSGLTGVIHISAQAKTNCAVDGSQRVWCWGDNAVGNLGDGTYTDQSAPVQVKIGYFQSGSDYPQDSGTLITNAMNVVVGDYQACALQNDTKTRCWGYNNSGGVGDGYEGSSAVRGYAVYVDTDPLKDVNITAQSTVIAVANNYHTGCVLLENGTLKCWGANDYGQLGIGKQSTLNTPQAVVDTTGSGSLSNLVEIEAGFGYSSFGSYITCARNNSGNVYCWGYSQSSGVNWLTGNGKIYDEKPVLISGVSNVTQLAAGNGHVCSLLSGGTVKCWGTNYSGEMGYNSLSPGSSTPQTVVSSSGSGTLTNVVQISAGQSFSCARLNSGAVYCWGKNNYGQLGTGNTTDLKYPIKVNLASDTAVDIASGANHSCAALADGSVQCWGYNNSKQCGDNGGTTNETTPFTVPSISTASKVGAGVITSFAVLANGTVACWGSKASYACGESSTTGLTATPVSVSTLNTAVTVSAGEGRACALLNDESVWCWGYNQGGEMGTGSTSSLSTPAALSGITGVLSLNLGRNFGCAVVSGGTAKCWGTDDRYQLGQGVYRLQPSSLSGF